MRGLRAFDNMKSTDVSVATLGLVSLGAATGGITPIFS